jgi:hypothetical protein
MAGEDMSASRRYIPRMHFNGKWDNLMARRGGRAVDYMDFLLYVVPTLLIPRMNSDRIAQPTKTIMNNLIIACHLSTRWDITHEDISFVSR